MGRRRHNDPSTFGEPRETTHYALCYYDGTDPLADPEFETSFSVPSDSFRWKKTTSGKITYRERFGEADGVTTILLFAKDDGKTRIKVKGKGDELNLPEPVGGGKFFTVQDEVVAQLVNDDGMCWEGRFDENDTKDNGEAHYKAKAKVK